MTELANWVAGAPTPMPGNYNARRRLRLESLRPAPRSARRDVRRPSGAGDRRVELRHRHGRQLLGGERRHRNVRIDSQPGEPEHAGRHQADGRADQPLRRDSDHGGPGHGRPDGEDRDRRRHPARRARGRGARSERCRHPHVHAAAESRLHALPAGRMRSRARASAFRARSSTTRVTPPGREGAARRPRTRSGEGRWRRPSRCSNAQGAVIVDPADIPSVDRHRSDERTSCAGTRAAAPTAPAASMPDCSIVFKYGMKRDFNAWLASLGRPAPVKTLTELRIWNLAHAAGRRHQVRAVAPRHLR